MMTPELLLFDLYSGGHHAAYVDMIVRRWQQRSTEAVLAVAVPRAMLAAHPALAVRLDDDPRLRAIPMDVELPEGDLGLRRVLANDLAHGRELQRAVAASGAKRVLALYADHVQASLALRRVPDRPLSGLYFRASFHYADADGVPSEPLVTRTRKRLLLRAALSNPVVERFFSLDPDAAAVLDDPRVVPVPDGVVIAPPGRSAAQVRDGLGASASDRIALFFGVVSARKGIEHLAAAVDRMPPGERARFVIVVAGRTAPADRALVDAALASMRATDTRLIRLDGYIDDETVSELFLAADMALLPYRRHIGSSNVLIRAAASGTITIGSDFGLVGRQIRRHGLGFAVDTRSADRLADAMIRAAEGDTSTFDPETAAAFAAENSAQAFADTVLSSIPDVYLPTR